MRQLFLIILILLASQRNDFAQIIVKSDSLQRVFLLKVKEQDSIISESKRIQDSLGIEFYKRPPLLSLTFEKNKEDTPITDNYNLWFENGKKIYYPRRVETNQFLSDSIIDTITIVLNVDFDTLKFANIGYGWIRNGASLKFGIIENIEEIRTFYRRHKRDEDFDEWNDIGQPYLGLIKDKQIKRQKRKIGSIEFLVLTPRVYGDGAILQVVNIKPR
jgi:hypothetical protein